jgi:glycosyltransferase involved in cell wall biosynthesis
MCDVSGASELVGDGKGGCIVARDPGEIARLLSALASDVQVRQQLGREAREKVERCFHWDSITNRTETFYRRLLEQRRMANAQTTRRTA